jgi:creatinine amidohydrolase
MTFHSRFWADYTAPDFMALPREQVIAVLPVAATEQHGPHLPFSVDTTIADGLVKRTIDLLPAASPVLFLPTVSVGKSNEHARYPGTLTYSADTLIRMWMELGASVALAGVKKMVLFNSHGGQASVMDIVARDLRAAHDILVVSVNWYMLGLPEGLFSAHEQKYGIHAGEIETAMMLALNNPNVNMARARDFPNAWSTRPNQWIGAGAPGKVGWQTQDLNPDGAVGDASRATRENGVKVIDFVAQKFVELLAEIEALPMSALVAGPSGKA